MSADVTKASGSGAPGAEGILSARTTVARPPVNLVGEKVCEQLLSFARVLEEIKGQPVLKARMAVLMLDSIAQLLPPEVPPRSLEKLWIKDGTHSECHDAVQVLKACFSLPVDSIRTFREADPEFAFKYLLYRELFHGRIPVIASDLKDTLATFVHSVPFDKLDAHGKREAMGFRGVSEAIAAYMRNGQFFIVTGDTHGTVLDKFLTPNGWVGRKSDALVPLIPSAQNLMWLPRTGMELWGYDTGAQCFNRHTLARGISEADLPVLNDLLREAYRSTPAAAHFDAESRRYPHRPDKPRGSIDNRRGEGIVPAGAPDDDYSIAFYPAGVLTEEGRTQFKTDSSNPPMLEVLVAQVNLMLAERGMQPIKAKRGGLSTVDLVTADKGTALDSVRARFLKHDEVLVFLGDRTVLNGNDVEGVERADISVQVGSEWDPHGVVPGSRILLKSKRLASEGGAAEYIRFTTQIRRLGMTGILGPPPEAPSESGILLKSTVFGANGSAAVLHEPDEDLHHLVNSAQATADRILAVTDREKREQLAAELAGYLKSIPSGAPGLIGDPQKHLDIMMLKRVVKGRIPVIAADIKDTVAAFDREGCDWFLRTNEAFADALRSGPVFLITGDSLGNLTNRFLVPGGIIERAGRQMTSPLAGISNLHLITRNGLDRVIFNFATGEFDRYSLIQGLSARDEVKVMHILERATQEYRCGELFGEFRTEEGKGPGFVDLRGIEYGLEDRSFAFFPAGVLLRPDRARFRQQVMDSKVFRDITAFIRRELYELGLDKVLAQQGGISTIDLTTTTKGSALAQLRRDLLGPESYFVYIGDTVTQTGNDGSAVGVAEMTVQVGDEQDPSIAPPPRHYHYHWPTRARAGGAGAVMDLATRARRLHALGLWTPASQK